MSTIIVAPPDIGAESPWPLYKISLDQYEAMVGSGVFTKRDRLHLINGLLVAKMTQGDTHCVADDLCRVALSGVIPAGWFIRSAKPVRLPPDCEPEPDHAVVRGAIRDYRHGHPGPADVGQIVEIADSSLTEDRKMACVYGAAGVPIYWIVNLAKPDRGLFETRIPTDMRCAPPTDRVSTCPSSSTARSLARSPSTTFCRDGLGPVVFGGLNAFARSWEGEPPGEPQRHPARTEPRPPALTQGHLGAGAARATAWPSKRGFGRCCLLPILPVAPCSGQIRGLAHPDGIRKRKRRNGEKTGRWRLMLCRLD